MNEEFESGWYWVEEPGHEIFAVWLPQSAFQNPEHTLLKNATRVSRVKPPEEKDWVKFLKNQVDK